MEEVMMKRISFAFSSLNQTLVAMNASLKATNELLANILAHLNHQRDREDGMVMEPDPDSFDEEPEEDVEEAMPEMAPAKD